MKKRVFYCIDNKHDSFRAKVISEIDALDGNSPPSLQVRAAFETLGDDGRMHWINNQMLGRQCTVVLIGAATASRAWTYYEIVESWNRGMGVVGLNIHGIEDENGQVSAKGRNPLDEIRLEPTGEPLSSIAKSYDPTNSDKQVMLEWIKKNLTLAAAEAIQIRNKHKSLSAIYSP